MISPVVALKDQSIINQYKSKLPQSLIIVAEPGLDGLAVAEQLAKVHSADVLKLDIIKNKTLISVEQTRELVMSLRTNPANKRLVIVPRAELMSEQAQNSLLKAIEEPGSDTYFVLITPSLDSLLVTIQSRCQHLTLHRTSSAQDVKIIDRFELPDTKKQQILFLAAGRPLLIEQLAKNPKVFEQHKQLATDAKQLLAKPRDYQTLAQLNKYTVDRHQLLELIDILIRLIKFKIHQSGSAAPLTDILSRAEAAESLLKSNGSTKLALLKLVV
ncbi:hypothetical protein CR969_02595 [Candidatus Saccharibacteria bacterium]|nr:MAG: hypothetical protein CR969_02595 [Candidatus Saccharibacteria bacterium]